jgi:hypothetical protein
VVIIFDRAGVDNLLIVKIEVCMGYYISSVWWVSKDACGTRKLQVEEKAELRLGRILGII